METTATRAPNPALLFDTAMGYQKTAAVKAAVDLDIFTAISDGAKTAAEIASRCSAAEKGIRILCDYLAINGFLEKNNSSYSLTPDTDAFLNRNSKMYMGTVFGFLASPEVLSMYTDIAPAVQKGGSAEAGGATVEPENPVWVKFARSMMPMMMMPAQLMAENLGGGNEPLKVLDIAAGHGVFGICVAMRNPNATIYGADWGQVLEVAKENAAKFGIAGRYHTIPGDAFETDFGSGYDLVLVPNFLHHFSPQVNTNFLKKVHAALKPGGRAATVEFVPNEDRVTPPMAARFSLTMLVGTPEGDAYTFAEFERMFADAGFAATTSTPLEPSPQTLLISHKAR